MEELRILTNEEIKKRNKNNIGYFNKVNLLEFLDEDGKIQNNKVCVFAESYYRNFLGHKQQFVNFQPKEENEYLLKHKHSFFNRQPVESDRQLFIYNLSVKENEIYKFRINYLEMEMEKRKKTMETINFFQSYGLEIKNNSYIHSTKFTAKNEYKVFADILNNKYNEEEKVNLFNHYFDVNISSDADPLWNFVIEQGCWSQFYRIIMTLHDLLLSKSTHLNLEGIVTMSKNENINRTRQELYLYLLKHHKLNFIELIQHMTKELDNIRDCSL